MGLKVKEGARFFDELPEDDQDAAEDQTLQAIHALAASVKDLAGKQPQIDLAPIMLLVKQIQDSQERIVKFLKPQNKKRWNFEVTKRSNGNMTIEAVEQ